MRQMVFVLVGVGADPSRSVCSVFTSRSRFLTALSGVIRGQAAAIKDILSGVSVDQDRARRLNEAFEKLDAAYDELVQKCEAGEAMPPEWFQKNLNVICESCDAVATAAVAVFEATSLIPQFPPPRLRAFMRELDEEGLWGN